MASENDIKKLNELLEKNKISDPHKKLQEMDVICYESWASREDVGLFDSLPSLSLLGEGSGGNQEHANQELGSGGVHHPPISTYDHLADYSNLNTQGYLASQEGLKILYPVYNPAGKVYQGRDQLSQGQGIGSFRLSSQMLVDNCRDKVTGKFNRSRDFRVSSETRGPRANRREGTSSSIYTKKSLDFLTRRDKYNLQDFQIKYEEAKFFMIKSYSEEDIHKSIKYNVWSSTHNGNRKLDAAFREADARAKGISKCPIFLFFSVNTSGQFVGLAEMIGSVDFNRSMDFWQQDKWRGFFPVKWHIIKDIPNGLFRNIILENNDNKAVTYSRDTQEIGLPQGLKMLQIFKTFQVETSILDDFVFYEEKEKSLRARRTALERSGGATNFSNSSLKHPEISRRMESRRSDRMLTSRTPVRAALTGNLSLNTHQRSNASKFGSPSSGFN